MYYRRATLIPALFVSVLIAVPGLVPGSAYAQQNDVTVTVPGVEPNVGETVTLSIEADLGGNEVDSYTNMEFTFDSSVLDIMAVRDGDELSFGSQNLTTNEDVDTLRVTNIADNPPVSGSGEFLEIDVELTQEAGIAFKLTPSNTQTTVPTSIFGDANGGNLEIDSIDQGRVGLLSVQEARQQGPDSPVAVQGTVTRAFGAYVRLQDDSGPTGASGLVVRQTADTPLATDFRDDITDGTITQGTQLEVIGTLSEFAGLLQINNEDFDGYSVLGQGSLPPVQVVSLSDIEGPDGEDYESELLRIENLSFPNRDTTDGTLDGSTTYVVEDQNGTEFPYRVQDASETTVIGATIPLGTFTYEGVLGQYNDFSGNDEGYQLNPVRASTGLPVELVGFDAVRSGSSVELRWQTASETNNAGFRVQHERTQGWQELGFVESKAIDGTTTEAQSYRFSVERDLTPGTHRFRLKQVDLDGTTHLSKVVSVEVRMDGALSLTAPAPNPTSGRATLSFGVKDVTETQVVLYNVLGQRVKTLYDGIPRAGQSKALTFDTAGLPSGVYILQLRAKGQTRTQRLTVVR